MAQPDIRPSPWSQVHGVAVPLDELPRERVPACPGVLVLYCEGRVAWFGKSADLRSTFAHLLVTQGPAALSPARRRVASRLGIGAPAEILSGRYRPTPEDQARISRWLRACTVAWVECESEAAAVMLEGRLLGSSDNPGVAG